MIIFNYNMSLSNLFNINNLCDVSFFVLFLTGGLVRFLNNHWSGCLL
jgi:hypothetical protein